MASVRLISRLQLVNRLDVSKSVLYRDCENEQKLKPAMVGAKVDLDHKSARLYCAEHNYREPDIADLLKNERNKKPPAPEKSNVVLPPDNFDIVDPDDADSYLEMTLKEIITRYGTQPQFKDFVSASKNLLQMRGMEEEQARKRGEYIHRVHVEKLVALIDAMTKTLLSDVVSNLAISCTAQIKADATQPEIEETIRSNISRTIKTTKAQVVRGLRDV